MNTRLSGLLLLVIALGASEAAAQSVAGTYTWEVATRMRRDEGGTETVDEKAQARLTIQLKGDSIVGSYAVALPGRETPAREVRGTWKGNTITFNISSRATLNVNGDERQVETVQVYTATIDGDEIKGTITVQVPDGSFTAPVRQFAGKRAKA